MAQIAYDKDLVRVDNPEPDTEERRAVVPIIEDMWPASPEEIAEQTDFSHGHVRNTLSSHFRFVDPDESKESDDFETITIPSDVQNKADFLKGYTEAMQRV